MKKIEITFTAYSKSGEELESCVEHEFHDKIIRSILRDAAAFKKEYERDTGEIVEDGDYCYAEGVDLSDVLFESQYQTIYNECIEEARNNEIEGNIKILIETDLASFLEKLDKLGD